MLNKLLSNAPNTWTLYPSRPIKIIGCHVLPLLPRISSRLLGSSLPFPSWPHFMRFYLRISSCVLFLRKGYMFFKAQWLARNKRRGTICLDRKHFPVLPMSGLYNIVSSVCRDDGLEAGAWTVCEQEKNNLWIHSGNVFRGHGSLAGKRISPCLLSFILPLFQTIISTYLDVL